MPIDDHIRIEAPDVTTAFGLERRLVHLQPTTVSRHGKWAIELHACGDRLDEIEVAIRHWLRDYGLRSTRVEVDGGMRTVAAPPGPGPDATAVDYDGRVLAHEP